MFFVPQKRFSSYFIFLFHSHLFYIFPRYRFCRSNISDDSEKKQQKYIEGIYDGKMSKIIAAKQIFFQIKNFSLVHTQKEPQFFNRLTGNLSPPCYAMLSLLFWWHSPYHTPKKYLSTQK